MAKRLEEWKRCYWVDGPEKLWLLERLVVESVRLDRCRDELARLRREEAARARLRWDDDRRDEAEDLAAQLSADPAPIARRLRRTKQGAQFLIGQWRALGALVGRDGRWTKQQDALARDLMGIREELRDSAPIDDPARLVKHEIADLERRIRTSLDELDERERLAVEQGHPLYPSKMLRTLRGYEAKCMRRYQEFAAEMREHRLPVPQAVYEYEPAALPGPEPVPQPEPGPEPIVDRSQCDSGQDDADRTPSMAPEPVADDDPVARAGFPPIPPDLLVAVRGLPNGSGPEARRRR